MNKEIDMEDDTIKIALLDNSHSFDAADNEWADVSANEISGAGYDAGGKALTGKGVTQAATTKFDATDVSWINSTIAFFFGVIYDDTLANKDLIACLDFGGEQSITDGTVTLEWDAAGIITLAD